MVGNNHQFPSDSNLSAFLCVALILFSFTSTIYTFHEMLPDYFGTLKEQFFHTKNASPTSSFPKKIPFSSSETTMKNGGLGTVGVASSATPAWRLTNHCEGDVGDVLIQR